MIGLVVALVVVAGGGAGGAYWWWNRTAEGDGGLLLEGEGAAIADEIFAPDPNATGDGSTQQLLDAAAVGETAVAVGSEAGPYFVRPLFVISEDAGETWRLAEITAADDGNAPLDEYPKIVAASGDGWIALGGRSYTNNAVWTSRDGRTWTRQGDAGGRTFRPGDSISDVAGTASGFVAVGHTYPEGDYSNRQPVLWRSADGVSWQRLGGQELDLPAPDAPEPLSQLREVVARGDNVLVTGSFDGSTHAVWLSTDGGRTWQQASMPEEDSFSEPAIAASAEGFLMLQRVVGDDYDRFLAVFSSSDGRSWTELGRVNHPSAGSAPGGTEIVAASGGYGLLLGRGSGDSSTLFTSKDGRSWGFAGESSPGTGLVSTVGLTVAGTNTIVAGSAGEGSGSDGDPLLAVAPAGGELARIDAGTIPDLIHPDRSLIGLGTADGATVAVGSTNGRAAIWTSDSGSTWRRADVSPDGLAADGSQSLRAVVRGEQGWLTAGTSYRPGETTGPLLLTSDDAGTWHAVGDDELFQGGDEGSVLPYDVAAGPAGYAVAGTYTAQDGSYSSAVVWHSRDLRTWQQAEGAEAGDLAGSESAGRWASAVTAGPFGFVAAGEADDPDAPEGARSRPAVWTSQGGTTWSLQTLPLPHGAESASLGHVASKADTIVAIGTAWAPDAAPELGRSTGFPVAYVSTDGGQAWAPAPVPEAPGAGGAQQGQGADGSFVTDVTASPQGFVAVGAGGPSGRQDVVLWSSPDGLSWQVEGPEGVGLSGPGTQVITETTVIGADLVGVGYTADHREQHLTLWRTEPP